MKKLKLPTSLKGWLNLLYKQQLPILVHTGKSLVPQMLNPNISLKQMGLLIEQDPVLSFYIFREAKRANYENNTEIKSISHALSLVGLETVQNLIRRLPVLLPKENPFRAYYYLTAISNSLYAACQARYWAETKHHYGEDDLFWACLFSNIAYWSLWYVAHGKMQQIDEIIRTRQASRSIAEKHILGCTLLEISANLTKSWHLPELAQRSFHRVEQPSIKQLATLIHKQRANLDTPLIRIINSPVTSIQLANCLSIEASVDWYGKAIQHSFKLIAKHLNMPVDKCINECLRIAIYSARHYTIPGALQPAARLLLSDNSPLQIPEPITPLNIKRETNIRNEVQIKQQKPEQANQQNSDKNIANGKTTANTTKPADIPKHTDNQQQIINAQQSEQALKLKQSPESNKSLYPELASDSKQTNKAQQADIKNNTEKIKTATQQKAVNIQSENHKSRSYIYKTVSHQLVNQPHQFADMQSILNSYLKGLSKGLDLHRTVLYQPNKNSLRPFLTVGCEDFLPLQRLQLDLSKPSLLSIFMDKQTSLWVNEDNIENVIEKLPTDFRSATHSNDFFLISFFIKQKPFGFIFADRKPCDEILTEAEYKSFKLLSKATSRCLEQLASRNSRKRA